MPHRSVGDARGSTREFLSIGVQQTYYTDPDARRSTRPMSSFSCGPRSSRPLAGGRVGRVCADAGARCNGRLEYDVTGNGLQTLAADGTLEHGRRLPPGWSFSRQRPTPGSDVSSYVSGSSSLAVQAKDG